MPKPDPRTREAIVDATIEIIVSDGYDAVVLGEVAKRARVSLATIYKLFPTRREKLSRARDEVIVAAVEKWITQNIQADAEPPPDETVYDGLMRMLRYAFGPWERTPGMLVAYHRASNGPHRLRVRSRMFDAIAHVGLQALETRDAHYSSDVGTVLELVSDGVIGLCADGHLDVAGALPTLERVVYRLTADNSPAATWDRTESERVT